MTKEEEIKQLRKLLWLNHGHLGLYGDDGEQQCSECMLDFKRTPIGNIIKRFDDIAFDRMVKYMKKLKNGK